MRHLILVVATGLLASIIFLSTINIGGGGNYLGLYIYSDGSIKLSGNLIGRGYPEKHIRNITLDIGDNSFHTRIEDYDEHTMESSFNFTHY